MYFSLVMTVVITKPLKEYGSHGQIYRPELELELWCGRNLGNANLPPYTPLTPGTVHVVVAGGGLVGP